MLSTVFTRALGESRGGRVAKLIGLLWLLSFTDLAFTLWAHFCTPFHELNPLARALLDDNRVALLILVKMLLTATGVTIFWHLRRFARAEVALWMVVVAYFALAVHWSDYATGVVAMNLPL